MPALGVHAPASRGVARSGDGPSVYRRSGYRDGDFLSARAFEEEVGTWLGESKVPTLNSPVRLDYWLPGVPYGSGGTYLDVKEKVQPLSGRWTRFWPGALEADLFVIDELSVRKAAEHCPHAYFLIRDVPGGNRIFLARVDEVFCADRVRLNRHSSAGHRKGKWLVNVVGFRRLTSPADQLLPTILADVQSAQWRQAQCLTGAVPVPDV